MSKKAPMKIKKAKADAPLWEPQINETCEYQLMKSRVWVRCRVLAKNEATYTVEAEINSKLTKCVSVPLFCLREGKAPASKKDQIVRLLKEGKNEKALAMAAKFPDLGEHRDAITKGNNAAKNPDFYLQIKQDPAALVAAGIAALRARYIMA